MFLRQLILAFLFAASAYAAPQEGKPAVVAQELAVLELRDLAGQRVTLESLRGRIVVLNFWATWCVPCREEMPMLERIQREYAARGIVVVGASADDEKTQRQIAPFLRKNKLTFPIWVGATTQDMESLALGAALPATAVIDREGRIAGRIVGPLEEADLRRRIAWMLGEGQGDPPAAVLNTFEKAKHEHGEEEDHQHGGVSLEGASTVPS